MSENKSTGNGKVEWVWLELKVTEATGSDDMNKIADNLKVLFDEYRKRYSSWLRILKLSKTFHLRLTLSLVTN